MEKFEKLIVKDVSGLKENKVYFFLKEHGFSENYIKHLRSKEGSIFVNNQSATTRTRLFAGDIVKVLKSPNQSTQIEECDGNLEILFEDDDFLIVNKPAMLTCNPTRSHFSNNLGGQICKYMHQKDKDFVLRIINRLDKETAGIIVVAKNVFAQQNMTHIDKTYYAVCEGKIENCTICAPILTVVQNGVNQMKRQISPKGKHAVTHVEVVKSTSTLSCVKLKLETGRTHQIRVHMAHVGHPLLGDTIYGTPTNESPHTMLILKKISFKHFRSGQNIHIEVPFPAAPSVWKQFLE